MNNNRLVGWLLFTMLLFCRNTMNAQANIGLTPISDSTIMVRMAKIDIFPQHLDTYLAILKEESAPSVKIEPGVIAIFPMQQRENPTQIQLVEIYANKAAYQSHLQTPHLQHYKTTTQQMVKSLQLVEMNPVDASTMSALFRKLK